MENYKKNQQLNITIGLVMSRMHNEWNQDMAQGIKEAAFEKGINIIQYCNGGLRAKNPGPAQFNIVRELIDTEKLNALIIDGSAFSHRALQKDIEEFCQKFTSIPIVLVNKQSGSFYNVSDDEYKSVVIAVKHLAEVHHLTNIVHISSRAAINHDKRLKAFYDTMLSLNLPVNDKFVVTDVPLPDQNAELLTILLNLMKNGAEAIIAPDATARNTIFVLSEAGVKIPGEIAVMGINNQVSSQFSVPPLSSVERSFKKMGKAVIKKILSLINGEKVEKETKLEPILIRRGSCGCFIQKIHKIKESFYHDDLSVREGEFLDIKDSIISEMGDIVSNTKDNRDIINKLILAFDKELKKPGEYIFLNFIHNFIMTRMNFYMSPNLLHKILSLLIKHSIPYLKNREKYLKMQVTWQQARLLIDDITMHNLALTEFQTMIEYENFNVLSRKILLSANLFELLNVMAQEMPVYDFPFVYLVLYENPGPYKYPDPAPLYSRLVMAYTEKGRIEIDKSGIRFLTEKLLPEKIWEDYFSAVKKNFYCIVESLALDRKQIGYIIFGISGQPNDTTYWLKNVISNSLLRILLYK